MYKKYRSFNNKFQCSSHLQAPIKSTSTETKIQSLTKPQLPKLTLVLLMSMIKLLDNIKEVQHTAEEKQKSLYEWAVKHSLKMLCF